ncbi:uncharacterized protein [Miscanthus floridulus]|uniref:uncharacterized protein n=1 Tax=Miscanthus floridulus TaxID=154761 RepID=UPI00345755DF
MAVTTGGANDDGRDAVADPPASADPEVESTVVNKDAGKGPTTSPPGAPAPLPLLLPSDSHFKKMSIASGSQSPLSQASQAPSESLPLSASPQPESENESMPVMPVIDIDDDDMEVEEEDGVEAGSKRKLTSAVWTEFKRVKFNGTVRAKCIYCFKQLSATSTNGCS